MSTLEQLRADYDRLAGSRIGGLDAIGLAHAGRLLERVSTVPEVARERLLARARAALDAVKERAERTHRKSAERIDALERDGFEVGELRARLARGDVQSVERGYRRTRLLGRDVRRRDPALEARLFALARASGVDTTSLPASAGLSALAGRLFRRSAAEAAAHLVLERAERNRSADVGRYHTPTVVASVLLAMRDASQEYLRAQLARLELADEMQRFLTAFEPLKEPPKPAAERPRRATRAPKAEKRESAETPAKTPRAPASPRGGKGRAGTTRGKKR